VGTQGSVDQFTLDLFMVKILVGNYHVDIQIDQVVGGDGNLTWESDPH
jgi:hypothetical protein